MGLIPIYYAGKFWYKIDHDNDTSDSDDEGGAGIVYTIFLLIVLWISVLFILASPLVYFCLIVYHIDLNKKRKQRQEIFEEQESI